MNNKVYVGFYSHTYSDVPVPPTNRLSGAQHPTYPKMLTPTLQIRKGSQQTPQQAHNSVMRPVAGSMSMFHVLRQHPNSRTNITKAQGTARGFKSLNNNTRRGSGVSSTKPKSIAGTTDVYNAGGLGGQHSADTVQVKTHYIGFHRVSVTNRITKDPTRAGGQVENSE